MRDEMYEREIERHIKKMTRILDEYASKIETWSETDELAIERAFQVLIEAVIETARYFLNIKYSVSVSRSREAFDEMKSRGDLDGKTHEKIMKIIGFRNVLAHDYLEVESGIIRSILKNKSYHFLSDYSEKLLQEIERIIKK